MSVRRHTTTLVTTAPATMRDPMSRPASLKSGLACRPAAAGSAITSRPVEHEPRDHRDQKPQARVDEQQRTQMRLDFHDGEDVAKQSGEGEARRHADDPGRKE